MNISILSGLIFVAVFAGVILTHEFGHFIVARLLKVEVEEFGIGLPPRILTMFHWKDTAFTLNALPLGGFVKPKGENDPNIPGGLAASSPWTRLAVLFAGPTMNLLTAVIVFTYLFYQMGIPDYSKVQIGDVIPNSPAAQAGIQPNDIVLSVNGQAISDPTTLHDVIYANLDKPVTLVVQRGNQTVTITATPLSSRPPSAGALGISMGYALIRSGSLIESAGYGALAVYDQISLLVSLPAEMIRGQVSSDQGRFVGLKGIYDLFSQAVSRDIQSRQTTPSAPPSASPSSNLTKPVNPQEPTYFTFQLIALLTVSVGFINLLPFPALDGGRIFFVLLELIMRRRVKPEFENYVHAIGFAILIVFMIYVNAMDFIHPAVINLPK
jgi:regulator of sigma E protease